MSAEGEALTTATDLPGPLRVQAAAAVGATSSGIAAATTTGMSELLGIAVGSR
jgi:chromate transport protein ChrA